MPQPQPEALHNQQYTITANAIIGTLPIVEGKKRKRGERGKDASGASRRSRPRRCMTCVANEGPNFNTCRSYGPRHMSVLPNVEEGRRHNV
mmetsp:Transcript_35752/g.52508  ORF Transcript_35752/g.52508 Transcript_35752/m.52508 type:complete len:91 (+) Transcript_35752:518-790(+)|eukprot:scaffold1560_cov146-Skeletonema_dohrnii-CCMP3373.AAC.4